MHDTTPYGFGAFLFQCGDVRSSEWCVKHSLTLLFKRTISRLLYGIKLENIKQMVLIQSLGFRY
jgi:hypothetical protein